MTSSYMKFVLLAIFVKSTFCLRGLLVTVDANSTAESSCIQLKKGSDENERVTCRTFDGGLQYINVSLHESDFDFIGMLVVSPGVHFEKGVIVNGAKRLTIHGTDKAVVTGTCRNRDDPCNNTIVLLNIQYLKIENLNFTKFGNFHKQDEKFCHSAITIDYTNTITINNVTIHDSKGGGLCLKHTLHSLKITNSNFANNYAKPKYNNVTSGGVWISTGDNVSASYFITNCHFINNRVGFFHRDTLFQKYKLIGEGHGGGFLLDTGNNCNVSLYMTNTNFHKNRATYGGGASILVNEYINANISVFVSDCTFSQNRAHSSIIANGGGLQLLIQSGSNINITIVNTTFTSNKAYFGGGTSIAAQYNENKINISVTFIDCRWKNNTATSGSAVDVSKMFTDREIFVFSQLVTVFVNCSFMKNKMEYNRTREREDLRASLGSGVFSASLMNVVFNKKVEFIENYGSAIMGVNTVLTFNCPKGAKFTENVGINGGGISLQAFSKLNISNDTKMYFERNHAKSHGGAMYVHMSSDHVMFISSVCPFYRNITESEIYFSNNTADEQGNSIYFTSLLPCQMEMSAKKGKYLKAEEVFKNRIFKNIRKQDIATAPSSFIFHDSPGLTIYPGEKRKLNLTLIDDLEHTVDDAVFFHLFQISDDNTSKHQLPVFISEKIISYQGNPDNTTETLLLQTVEKPTLNIVVNVTIPSCPPGYTFNGNICVCDITGFYGFLSCNPTGKYETRIHKNVWIGHIHDKTTGNEIFVSGLCYWFCQSKSVRSYKPIEWHKIGNNRTLLSKYVCDERREGILCGECNSGYSTSYNGFDHKCIKNKKCSLGWLLLIIAEFLPFTIMIIAVMVLNINVASGYIQGFLLYSHMLVTISLHHFKATEGLNKMKKFFFHIFYYPLDLKFFYSLPSFCLYKNATALDNSVTTYLTIIYSVFLIFAVVFFMRCFNRKFRNCNRYIRFTTVKNSAIHGLLALFLLSYTRCVETSLILLQPATLRRSGGNKDEKSIATAYRAALYGQYKYFSPEHLWYAIPAMIGLILILIPSIALLLYPFFVKLQLYFNIEPNNSKISNIISAVFMHNTLKPFYDMFYSSFRDEHRYFAGLYLIYRILISLTYYFPSEMDTSIMTEFLFVIFLTIHAIAQPHVNKSHNTIDALLLTNLVMINGIAALNVIATYSDIEMDALKQIISSTIQTIIIILPIIILISHLVYKYVLKTCWQRYRGRSAYEELIDSSELIMHHRSMGRSSDFTKYQ